MLEWSPWTLKDRDAIFDFIEQDNPRAAIKIDSRIAEQTQRLTQFPESDRLDHCLGAFETLTLCPIDTRCLETSSLTKEELEWFNGYYDE